MPTSTVPDSTAAGNGQAHPQTTSPELNDHCQPLEKIEYRGMTWGALSRAKLVVEYHIAGLLAAKQPLIIAGDEKTLKTSIAGDLAISLVTGTPFLGVFPVAKPARVVVMTGESGYEVIRETLARIAKAKGVEPPTDDADDSLTIYEDVPQLAEARHLTAIGEMLDKHKPGVLLIDPVYMTLDGDEVSNLVKMGRLLKKLHRVCLDRGVLLALVHHFKMTREEGRGHYDLPRLQDISHAGFRQFAAQYLLLARRHEFDPDATSHPLYLVYGGRAGHRGMRALDIDEGRQDDIGGRVWRVRVSSAADARQAAEQQAAAAKVSGQRLRHQNEVTAACEAIRGYLIGLPAQPSPPSLLLGDHMSGICERCGIGNGSVVYRDAIAALLRANQIASVEPVGQEKARYRANFLPPGA